MEARDDERIARGTTRETEIVGERNPVHRRRGGTGKEMYYKRRGDRLAPLRLRLMIGTGTIKGYPYVLI